jgi:hypothetical protein
MSLLLLYVYWERREGMERRIQLLSNARHETMGKTKIM